MSYAEMQKAEAEYLKAVESKKAKKQRGATKAQLAYRAKLCVNCGEAFSAHSIQQTVDCANARS